MQMRPAFHFKKPMSYFMCKIMIKVCSDTFSGHFSTPSKLHVCTVSKPFLYNYQRITHKNKNSAGKK